MIGVKDDKREVATRICMNWDDKDDLCELIFIVPIDVTDDMVYQKIIETHNYLCFEDETDIYGTYGRTGETLAHYICQETGWEWKFVEFDVDVNLD